MGLLSARERDAHHLAVADPVAERLRRHAHGRLVDAHHHRDRRLRVVVPPFDGAPGHRRDVADLAAHGLRGGIAAVEPR